MNFAGFLLIIIGVVALIVGWRGTQAAAFHSATGK